MDCAECFAILQEEKESQAKADKIKLALEKLKEAKVKKVNCESVVCGAVQINDILLCWRKKKKSLISSGALQRGVFFFNLRAKINYIVIPSMTSVGLFVIDK